MPKKMQLRLVQNSSEKSSFSLKWHQSIYGTTPELLQEVFYTQRYSAHEIIPPPTQIFYKTTFQI